ncbi:MAG: hypothetical protein GY913_04275 [Proteobacteria bacterium]|nr:hypothetical protein [Pseudomonadota bacterium]
MNRLIRVAPLATLFAAACADVDEHDHDHDHNHGVTTSVVLNFTPTAGGDTLTFQWSDPEDDGNPVVDDILLTGGADQEFEVTVEFWNDLEDPAEDVTVEIAEQDEDHQIFFTGSGVEGPATGDNAAAIVEHAYADTDAGGLPVGLTNTFTTLDPGTGELIVTLRHLPPENDEAVKVDGLAEDVANGGFSAIGGENDVQVTFNIEVE